MAEGDDSAQPSRKADKSSGLQPGVAVLAKFYGKYDPAIVLSVEGEVEGYFSQINPI